MYDDSGVNSFQTGLRFRSGQAKPAYSAYRLPIVVHTPRAEGRVHLGPRAARHRHPLRAAQNGGRETGPKIHTNSLGYFGVKRKRRAATASRPTTRDGSKLKLLGTSRTARPI